MKRIIALLSTVILILSLAACSGTNKTNNLANLDAELERAVAYGIVTEDNLANMDETVTYKQFCELLTHVVSMLSLIHI